MGMAIRTIQQHAQYDRIIVLTDEQTMDIIPEPIGIGYIINVASYKNGIGYGTWNHINGWSESVLKFIQEFERNQHD